MNSTNVELYRQFNSKSDIIFDKVLSIFYPLEKWEMKNRAGYQRCYDERFKGMDKNDYKNLRSEGEWINVRTVDQFVRFACRTRDNTIHFDYNDLCMIHSFYNEYRTIIYPIEAFLKEYHAQRRLYISFRHLLNPERMLQAGDESSEAGQNWLRYWQEYVIKRGFVLAEPEDEQFDGKEAFKKIGEPMNIPDFVYYVMESVTTFETKYVFLQRVIDEYKICDPSNTLFITQFHSVLDESSAYRTNLISEARHFRLLTISTAKNHLEIYDNMMAYDQIYNAKYKSPFVVAVVWFIKKMIMRHDLLLYPKDDVAGNGTYVEQPVKLDLQLMNENAVFSASECGPFICLYAYMKLHEETLLQITGKSSIKELVSSITENQAKRFRICIAEACKRYEQIRFILQLQSKYINKTE